MKQIRIAIINYPQSTQSAVFGLQEQFLLANDICVDAGLAVRFEPEIIQSSGLPDDLSFTVVVLPPSIRSDYYNRPTPALLKWLHEQHRQGAVICSACAGAFILAATGLLEGRSVTTHWGLANEFADSYPELQLEIERILIDDGDVMTAGGLMSWVDLGMALVARYANSAVMRQLGRNMVVDTGARQQRFYQNFAPVLDHGDSRVLQVQQYLQCHYAEPLTVEILAQQAAVSGRTLSRHFVAATGLKPLEYLQKLRVQKACDQLETTTDTVSVIANRVGYADLSAFRRAFRKQMGLSPAEFRRRFTSASSVSGAPLHGENGGQGLA